VQDASDLHDDLGHLNRLAQQVDAAPAQPGMIIILAQLRR
jgi:hypothetical protein